MNSPLIDWEQLDMIADGFEPEFVEIYHEFLAEMPGLFASMREKMAANDALQVSRVAHQIKGSAANFGFIGISQPFSALEQESKGGSIANAATYLAQGEAALQGATAEVKSQRGV